MLTAVKAASTRHSGLLPRHVEFQVRHLTKVQALPGTV